MGNFGISFKNYEYDKFMEKQEFLHEGFPKFMIVYEYDKWADEEQKPLWCNFYKLVKINKKSLNYQEINSKLFYTDVLKVNFIAKDLKIPDFNDMPDKTADKIKIKLDELKCSYAICQKDKYMDTVLLGKPFVADDELDTDLLNVKEKFKKHKEELKKVKSY